MRIRPVRIIIVVVIVEHLNASAENPTANSSKIDPACTEGPDA